MVHFSFLTDMDTMEHHLSKHIGVTLRLSLTRLECFLEQLVNLITVNSFAVMFADIFTAEITSVIFYHAMNAL